MSKPYVKFLDDLAQMAGGTVDLISNFQRQLKESITEAIDQKLVKMNFVAREDFDRLETVLYSSLERIKKLEEQLESIGPDQIKEAGSARGKPSPRNNGDKSPRSGQQTERKQGGRRGQSRLTGKAKDATSENDKDNSGKAGKAYSRKAPYKGSEESRKPYSRGSSSSPRGKTGTGYSGSSSGNRSTQDKSSSKTKGYSGSKKKSYGEKGSSGSSPRGKKGPAKR